MFQNTLEILFSAKCLSYFTFAERNLFLFSWITLPAALLCGLMKKYFQYSFLRNFHIYSSVLPKHFRIIFLNKLGKSLRTYLTFMDLICSL